MSKIIVRSLFKEFGSTRALIDINLSLEANKIYGLLGRNGAGKTTLLNLISNKIFPTLGKVLIDGENVSDNDGALRKILYTHEKNVYPKEYKIKTFYKWAKIFYPTFDMDYAKLLCNKFKLNMNARIMSLSTGYSTIFKDILGLASNAEIILFDEPVLGLDANHRDLFYKELLANYISHPKTIVISTHLIDEITDVIEEVIILNEGEIMLQKNVEELLSSAYVISGDDKKVEKFIEDKKYVGLTKVGKYKQATILEHRSEIKVEDLDVSNVKLQKLFIDLTN